MVSTWFVDDDTEETRAWIEERRKEERSTSNQPSPIINLLDAVFQVDQEEVKYQAGKIVFCFYFVDFPQRSPFIV